MADQIPARLEVNVGTEPAAAAASGAPATPNGRSGMAELALSATLQAVSSRMATNVRDWSNCETDAFLYGVLVGWDCEEQHEHDEIMCSVGALEELAERYGWPEEKVARLREMRGAIARWSR